MAQNASNSKEMHWLGHMIPGVAGAYNRHQYDAERVEWLRRLSERLEELARPG